MTDSYTRAAAPQSWDPGGTTSGRCNMVSSEHQPWPSIQPRCCSTLKSKDHHRHCRQRGTTGTEGHTRHVISNHENDCSSDNPRGSWRSSDAGSMRFRLLLVFDGSGFVVLVNRGVASHCPCRGTDNGSSMPPLAKEDFRIDCNCRGRGDWWRNLGRGSARSARRRDRGAQKSWTNRGHPPVLDTANDYCSNRSLAGIGGCP
jgi:hypothetical protein